MTMLCKSVIAMLLFFVTLSSFAQTTTTVAGSDGMWNTTANWSNGKPGDDDAVATINKPLILNTNIDFGDDDGGKYTINSPVIDLPGGTAHTIRVADEGELILNSNLTSEGAMTLSQEAYVTIESGDTLTVGAANLTQDAIILIKAGGVMIVNGNVDLKNNAEIICNGELIINGNFKSGNSSEVSGSGNMTTTGTITTDGDSEVFNSENNCSSGPCSGRNLCMSNSNRISASQSICSAAQPAQLVNVSNPNGSYTIQWQSSTTSSSGGFNNITSANSLNYQPSALTQNTWYRRVITQGSCTSISPSLQMLVGTPIITNHPVNYSICGNSGTAKFSVTASGGTQLTYQWKVNGNNITNNSTYSGATTSTLTISATTSLNGNTYHCIVSNAGCAVSVNSNSAKLVISNSTPNIPTIGSVSGATCSQFTANWTASTNATIYYLDVATNSSFSSMVTGYNSKNVGNVTSCAITGLSASTTYYYRIRAYSSCGTSSNSTSANSATTVAVSTPTFSLGSSSTRCQGPGTTTYTATASNSSDMTYSLDATTLAYAGNSINSTTGAVTYAVGWSGTTTITASATGCNGPKTAVHTVTINTCTYTWNGSSSTNWATAANWSGNAVPSEGSNVIIPSGPSNMPVISGNAAARNLTIQTGASLKNNSNGNLSIAGNFANNGIFTDTGSVALNGTTNQTITGVGSFNNLTLNNASGAKLNNNLTIKGILTLTQGALNPNGYLLTIDLNSGAIAGSGTGSISQSIKLIKSCGTKWHHIGNPLGGTTVMLSQFTEHITIANGVLYKYNETNPSTNMDWGWVEVPASSFASTSMVPMIGHNIYVWPKRTTFDIVGTYNHNFSTSVPLTNTSSGQPLSDGWNFLSNPYPSTIDWDAAAGWSKSGVDNAIYVRDKSNNRYMAYINGHGINGGDQYISSMQGFWVKANSASGSIGINKNARVTSTVLKLYKGQATTGAIKLEVSSNGYSDETLITLNSAGTSNFDPSMDAYKLRNSDNNPNFSSQLNGVEYSINTISDTLSDIIIPLRITTAFDGQYKLSVNLNDFPDDKEILLIDKNSNVSQDLTFDSNYTFNNSNTDTSRFFIRMKKKANVTTGLTNAASSNIFMGSDGSIVTIQLNTSEQLANMSVLNMLGNEVYKNEKANVAGGLIREDLNLPNSGIYIIRLSVGDQTYTGRVYIK